MRRRDGIFQRRQPTEGVAVEAPQVTAQFRVGEVLRREPLHQPARRVIGHVGVHQVNKTEGRLTLG